MTALLWFRRDLRLADNPALQAALRAGSVVPVYIHDPAAEGEWPDGAASRWWLHHSLSALDLALRERGSRLIVRGGPALSCLRGLLAETGASGVFWNRRYEPALVARDGSIKNELKTRGARAESFNGALLYEPWQLARGGTQAYKVFTPFWKAMQAAGLDLPVTAAPAALPPVDAALPSLSVGDLGLLPKIAWDGGLRESWTPGESGAWANFEAFAEKALDGYATLRDRPDLSGVSRLSPHLHFGEIGPRQIVRALRERNPTPAGTDSYIRELAWREFAHHLLYHFPHTTDRPMDERFLAFPWGSPDAESVEAWRRGRTGIPLVDAGMRELWHTGWMHNRVRMVVASFLTKNLLQHWRHGARWFWDTLADADLANNTLGWQWTAGCGADAAPYFRIFNPVLQGQRFDPDGVYVRRWCPELAKLPTGYIHRPWEAPSDILKAAGVALGHDYPRPIADLQASRERALAAFAALKAAN